MKRCPKCGAEKSREEFSKHKSKKDGLRPWCRVCECAAAMKRYWKNPERFRANTAKWSVANVEKVRAKDAKYHEKNPLRRIHAGIMSRCYNPENNRYENYGGRGIGLYEPWHDFETFERELTALIGPRPSKEHSLDRYPFGAWHYQPYNVRWATREMQQNNLSSTRWLVIDGKPVPLSIAAREQGMQPNALRTRLHRGWSVEEALSRPIMTRAEAAAAAGRGTRKRAKKAA